MFKTLKQIGGLLSKNSLYKLAVLVLIATLNVFLDYCALVALSVFFGNAVEPSAEGIALPWPFSRIISPGGAHLQLVVIASISITLIVLKNIVAAIYTHASMLVESHINDDVARKYLHNYLSLSRPDLAALNPADTLRIINWRTHIAAFPISAITISIDICVASLLFVTLFSRNPLEFLMITITTSSFGVAIYMASSKYIHTASNEAIKWSTLLNRTLMIIVNGAADLSMFGKQKYSIATFLNQQSKYYSAYSKQKVVERLPVWLIESIGIALAICIVFFLSNSDSENISQSLTLVAITAWRIFPAIYRTVGTLAVMNGSLQYIKQLTQSLNLSEQVTADEQRSIDQPVSFDSMIEFLNVSYAYPGEAHNSLTQICLQIPKNTIVGFVGLSGSGKSTLLNLLCGMATPTHGGIYIDDKHADLANLGAWKLRIGLVSQSPYLFDGTIEENISFSFSGNEIDHNRVLSCAAKANLNEFLSTPDGPLDTRIGEFGNMLSGGQAQRIAIARALYKHSDIFIFDESTNSLDAQSEEHILSVISKLSSDSTILIVSHNTATLSICDTIVWLEKGEVVTTGAPNEILPLYIKSTQGGMPQ